MLSMAPDLVLNLIYGNAACSTYEQKERPEQPERERERDQGDVKRCATLGSSWVSSSSSNGRRRELGWDLRQAEWSPIANCHRHGALCFV